MGLTWIPPTEPSRWESALGDLPFGPAHRWEHAASLAAGGGNYGLLAGEGTAVVLEEIDGGVRTPPGFGGFAGVPSPEFWQAWRRRSWKSAYVGLHPKCCPWDLVPGAEPGRTVFVVDLARPDEERWRSLDGKSTRSDTRLPSGWSFLDESACRKAIVSLYPLMAERLGMGESYRWSAPVLKAFSEAVHLKWWGAADERGEAASVAAFAVAARGADYWAQASTEKGRGAGGAVLWRALEDLAQGGFSWANLGGGAREGDGLERFKAKWGGSRTAAGRWRGNA